MHALLRCLLHIILVLFLFNFCPAQDDIVDPLQDNYIFGNSAEIIVVYTGEYVYPYDHRCYQQVYDNDQATGQMVGGSIQYFDGEYGIKSYGTYIVTATGDFNGDSYDDYVAAWQAPDNALVILVQELRGTTLDPAKAHFWKSDTAALNHPAYESSCHQPEYRIVVGDFYPDPGKEFALAYVDSLNFVHVSIFDLDGGMNPVLKETVADAYTYVAMGDVCHHMFDIAAGDFNQDGLDEICLAGFNHLNDSGWTFVQVYDFDYEAETLVPKVSEDRFLWNHGYIPTSVHAVSGDFDNDAIDEVMVGLATSDIISTYDWSAAKSYKKGFDTDSALTTLNPIPFRSDGLYLDIFFDPDHIGEYFYFSMAASDLDSDGGDELITNNFGICGAIVYGFTETDTDTMVYLGIYREPEFDIYDESTFHCGWTPTDQSLAVVDVNANLTDPNWRPEIFSVKQISRGVGNWYDFRMEQYHPVYNPPESTNVLHLERVTAEDVDVWYESWDDSHTKYAIAGGDFDGDAIRVGPPTRTHITELVRPLVVLNAPPVHFDVFPTALFADSMFDPTGCFSGTSKTFQSIYETNYAAGTEVSSEYHSDHATSDEISGEIPILEVNLGGKLAKEYGDGFSKTGYRGQSIEITERQWATGEDKIYAVYSSYDLFEYPVYASDSLYGNLLVTTPGIQSIGWKSTRQLPSGSYIPTHESGNILSFADLGSFETYNDVGGIIKAGHTQDITKSSYSEWFLRFEDFSGGGVSDWWESEEEVGGSVGFLGFGYKGGKTYSENGISTHSSEVSEAVSVEVYLDSLEASYEFANYTVQAYYYWNNDGAMVVDYAVDIPEPSGFENWWETLYKGAPDPALILPYRNHPAKGISLEPAPHMQYFSPSIHFFPRDAGPNEVVSIRGKVNNFSLTDCTNDVMLKFYLGDPDAGGVLLTGTLGHDNVILNGGIDARSFRAFSFDYTLPTSVPIENRIYVVIDPNDEISEIHDNSDPDNNNKGFGILIIPDGSPTGIEEFEDLEDMIPNDFNLFANYPNPFNPTTTIMYSIPLHSDVELTVYNLLGREVRTLVDTKVGPGYHTVQWDGKDSGGREVSSGMYFYRLKSGQYQESRKMLLLK